MSQSSQPVSIPAPADLLQTPPVLSVEAQLSPSLQTSAGPKTAAYELKFLIDESQALRVQQWADAHMLRDRFSDPAVGGYQTTTLYLDTPERDMFFRNKGYRKHKFRLRRYGGEAQIFLERKTRKGNRVQKRRCDLAIEELSNVGAHLALENSPAVWFIEKTAKAHLVPACRLTYDRTAFAAVTDAGPLRLTLDRNIRGVPTDQWDLTPIMDRTPTILPTQVVCEFKFRGLLPRLFKEVIEELNLTPGGVSKYRRIMAAVFPGSAGHA